MLLLKTAKQVRAHSKKMSRIRQVREQQIIETAERIIEDSLGTALIGTAGAAGPPPAGSLLGGVGAVAGPLPGAALGRVLPRGRRKSRRGRGSASASPIKGDRSSRGVGAGEEEGGYPEDGGSFDLLPPSGVPREDDVLMQIRNIYKSTSDGRDEQEMRQEVDLREAERFVMLGFKSKKRPVKKRKLTSKSDAFNVPVGLTPELLAGVSDVLNKEGMMMMGGNFGGGTGEASGAQASLLLEEGPLKIVHESDYDSKFLDRITAIAAGVTESGEDSSTGGGAESLEGALRNYLDARGERFDDDDGAASSVGSDSDVSQEMTTDDNLATPPESDRRRELHQQQHREGGVGPPSGGASSAAGKKVEGRNKSSPTKAGGAPFRSVSPRRGASGVATSDAPRRGETKKSSPTKSSRPNSAPMTSSPNRPSPHFSARRSPSPLPQKAVQHRQEEMIESKLSHLGASADEIIDIVLKRASTGFYSGEGDHMIKMGGAAEQVNLALKTDGLAQINSLLVEMARATNAKKKQQRESSCDEDLRAPGASSSKSRRSAKLLRPVDNRAQALAGLAAAADGTSDTSAAANRTRRKPRGGASVRGSPAASSSSGAIAGVEQQGTSTSSKAANNPYNPKGSPPNNPRKNSIPPKKSMRNFRPTSPAQPAHHEGRPGSRTRPRPEGAEHFTTQRPSSSPWAYGQHRLNQASRTPDHHLHRSPFTATSTAPVVLNKNMADRVYSTQRFSNAVLTSFRPPNLPASRLNGSRSPQHPRKTLSVSPSPNKKPQRRISSAQDSRSFQRLYPDGMGFVPLDDYVV